MMTNFIYFFTAVFTVCVASINGRGTPYVTFKDVNYDQKCGLTKHDNWTLSGDVILPEHDKKMFRSELVIQAIMPICRVNLNTCSSDKRQPGDCYCAAKSDNTYHVHIGATAATDLSGRDIEAIIPGQDLYPGLRMSKVIGKIPKISESPEVKMTYQVNGGEVKSLMSKQTLEVCSNTWTSIKVCVPSRPRGSFLQLDDVEAVHTAKDSCITWTKPGIDFTTLPSLDLTVTYQATQDCPHADQFLIHIKEKNESSEDCLPTTLSTTPSTPATTTFTSTLTTEIPTTTTAVETTTITTTAEETTTTTTTPKTTSGPINHVTTMSLNQLDSYCTRHTVLANGQDVVCDNIERTNWILIQRKVSNAVNFNQPWAQYEQGFGDSSSNFWLGLKNIYALCNEVTPCQLRFDMVYDDQPYSSSTIYRPDHKYYATYDRFMITDSTDNYCLTVQGYSGTAGNEDNRDFVWNNNAPFTTVDHDNDGWSGGNCALSRNTGWWHGYCTTINPNGHVSPGDGTSDIKNAYWGPLSDLYPLHSVEIKVTPTK